MEGKLEKAYLNADEWNCIWTVHLRFRGEESMYLGLEKGNSPELVAKRLRDLADRIVKEGGTHG